MGCNDACDEHCGVGEARNPLWSCRTSAASAGDTNESACGSIWVYVSTWSGTSLVEALRVKSFIFLPLSADVSASDILVMMMMLYWELIELLCLVLWENTLALIFYDGNGVLFRVLILIDVLRILIESSRNRKINCYEVSKHEHAYRSPLHFRIIMWKTHRAPVWRKISMCASSENKWAGST